MKTFISLCISFLFCATYLFAQISSENEEETDNPIKLKLIVFENSKEGKKYKIYQFWKNKFHVYEKPFATQHYTEHVFTKHKFNSKQLFAEIAILKLDTLKELYFNNCINSDNGYDYSILIETRTKTNSTMLHHYYIEQVADLISLINKHLPQTMQIQYLIKETKHDCSKLD